MNTQGKSQTPGLKTRGRAQSPRARKGESREVVVMGVENSYLQASVKDLEARVRRLEVFQWKLMGIGSVLLIFIELVMPFLRNGAH